ncbi:exodeoxyribonuclease VII large subunit [Gymnodinialimonas ulvae]|uniref:exodeoxyribonuclease VII large subunit n=1 Tax=Gymnodinialimonas ulvae TaxID=3126504 RepID=UPI0030ABDB0E
MDDLIDDETAPGANAPEFSVSELTGAIKKTLEGSFGRVRVRGEIGRVVQAKSGHLYYDVKDDRSVIACNTWKGQIAGLGMRPEEGMEVIVTGRLSTFGPQSKYNLNVDTMEIAGAGALMAMLEKRRRALAAEGLFDETRKQPLPFLPEVIGVVTSPSGAVIRDILHRLRDRFPRKVLIWPVTVQGERCAPEVANGIRGFNALTPGGALPRPDLLIVARGGGSMEDLWGFNEEIVVRAVAESDIPLISAVGHETDTTLIDYASDYRAPTPTGAAEKAVPVRLDMLNWVRQQDGILTRAITGALAARGQRVRDVSRALPRPDAVLEAPRQRLDLAALRLSPALKGRTQDARARLDRLAARLDPALERAVASKRLDLGRAAGRLSPARLQALLREGRRALSRWRIDPRRLTTRTSQMEERLSTATERFAQVAEASVMRRRAQLEGLERLRTTLGYKQTLARGYAVIRSGEAVLTEKAQAQAQAALEIEFADGRLGVTPTGATPKPAAKKPAKTPKPGGGQGSLF